MMFIAFHLDLYWRHFDFKFGLALGLFFEVENAVVVAHWNNPSFISLWLLGYGIKPRETYDACCNLSRMEVSYCDSRVQLCMRSNLRRSRSTLLSARGGSVHTMSLNSGQHCRIHGLTSSNFNLRQSSELLTYSIKLLIYQWISYAVNLNVRYFWCFANYKHNLGNQSFREKLAKCALARICSRTLMDPIQIQSLVRFHL